jgi:ubiquinol-cytochrome c reductase iron-sulfur subunit
MKPTRFILIAFSLSMAASVALTILYFSGGNVQLEGLLLGVALGGLGLGIAAWANDLLVEPEQVEEREPLATDEGHPVTSGDEITRRRLLVGMAGGSAALLGGALAVPALSLGPRPGEDLFHTKWTRGARVVDEEGRPLRPEDVELESVTTVYPEGEVGSADSQAVLVKVAPELLALSGRGRDWVPEGCVAYSKICTHAGCPVGLYRAEAHELLCPCHQSTFDVLRGATPVFGPAARALPQLPLELDENGYLVAGGDFPEPVGPSFWNMTRSS